ncbi:MAG: MarR family transcriptional regulator, partial [Candidatus Sumerlaeota bacterium]|nr:MarR family transcriptional regulator [Candidatus Sumerlaeota bacterium]
METWKEFDDNEVSHSVAHYLLAIRELAAQWGYARVSDIAEKLGITKGSASQSLKQLKSRGLVAEDEHRMLHLSPEGEQLADRIAVRAEHLKEFFHNV